MPLLLWVSLYRIFYMGRVFNFLGMWVEQSDISLALVIFTTQFLHLLCFGDQAQDSSAPDSSQPCSSCSQCMLCSCPVVQRCRVAQLSPSQPAWSPLDPPARSSLTFPAWCHLQSSQSPYAVFLFLPDILMCSQHGSWHSSSPSCLFPMPQVLVPFTWAIDPTSPLGEKPQFICSVLRHFLNV